MAKKTRRQLLGQHFLHEKGTLHKIIKAIDPDDKDLILEIGPGQGTLSFPLTAKAGEVVAVEKDFSLVKFLEEKRISNLKIIAGDVLAINLRKIIREKRKELTKVKLVGNLPYHISTQILFVLLEVKDLIERAIFLFQKEVAERIVASPGNKKYAPLSILLQNYFHCHILFSIKPGAFRPPPKVESACVAFYPRGKPLLFSKPQEKDFYDFLLACFRQRRKTLVKNLAIKREDRDNLLTIFRAMNLGDKVRAEQLSAEQIFEVFNRLKNFKP